MQVNSLHETLSLNESVEPISFYTMKCFQVLLSNTNNSINIDHFFEQIVLSIAIQY